MKTYFEIQTMMKMGKKMGEHENFRCSLEIKQFLVFLLIRVTIEFNSLPTH